MAQRPRQSVLTLFDPLNSPIRPSTSTDWSDDDDDVRSGESDKENFCDATPRPKKVFVQDAGSETTFFKRTYSRKNNLAPPLHNFSKAIDSDKLVDLSSDQHIVPVPSLCNSVRDDRDSETDSSLSAFGNDDFDDNHTVTFPKIVTEEVDGPASFELIIDTSVPIDEGKLSGGGVRSAVFHRETSPAPSINIQDELDRSIDHCDLSTIQPLANLQGSMASTDSLPFCFAPMPKTTGPIEAYTDSQATPSKPAESSFVKALASKLSPICFRAPQPQQPLFPESSYKTPPPRSRRSSNNSQISFFLQKMDVSMDLLKDDFSMASGFDDDDDSFLVGNESEGRINIPLPRQADHSPLSPPEVVPSRIPPHVLSQINSPNTLKTIAALSKLVASPNAKTNKAPLPNPPVLNKGPDEAGPSNEVSHLKKQHKEKKAKKHDKDVFGASLTNDVPVSHAAAPVMPLVVKKKTKLEVEKKAPEPAKAQRPLSFSFSPSRDRKSVAPRTVSVGDKPAFSAPVEGSQKVRQGGARRVPLKADAPLYKPPAPAVRPSAPKASSGGPVRPPGGLKVFEKSHTLSKGPTSSLLARSNATTAKFSLSQSMRTVGTTSQSASGMSKIPPPSQMGSKSRLPAPRTLLGHKRTAF